MGLRYDEFMAHTPKLNRRENRHLLNDERFYKLLAKECNYMDRDSIFVWYMALVAVVGEELRQHGMARLPHLGDFSLSVQKSRTAWAGKAHVVINPREVLKFYPKEHLRRYFNKRQGPLRYLEVLPPAPFK